MLSFQSLVDATVSTPATVNNLFDRLPPNHSELVLFDFNRHARLDPFIRPEDLALMGRMFEKRARNYRITVVTPAWPPGARALEDDGAQALGGAVDRRGESRSGPAPTTARS